MQYISKLSAIASTLAFLGTYFVGSKSVQILFLILFLISVVILLVIEIKNRPKKFKNANEINVYMHKWISNIGRVVIFTRDMSWVAENPEIIGRLQDKAKNKELIICMPVANQIATDLRAIGAQVIEYSNLHYTPQSRFTIVHFGRSDAKIAIGKTYDEGQHIIEEYDSNRHPLFYVAQDLIYILTKANESKINL